jgi:phosphatidyl-myo-inositol alpha-mannosyltransferase
MKIGLVCPYAMFGHAGGVPQVVTHLAKALTVKGHEVKIITPRPNKIDGEAPDGFIFLGNSRKVKAGLATAGDIGIEFDGQEIDDVLAKERFDVINFHEPWLPHLSRQIVQKSNAAHVATFHASLIDSVAGKSLVNMTSLYWRSILDKMQVFTAVSEAASAGLLAKEGSNDMLKHIKYIPNGIDLARYQKAPVTALRNRKMKTIFYVGRLEGRKGLRYLLRAYGELVLTHDDVQLFIAGKGPDETKLRDYVRDNEIPRVTFLGFISDDDKIHHLHKSDLFCSPANRGESFGIVLLEAMAAGCPIVAGDNSGYRAVMKDTGAISLVNPLDTIDFVRRLEIMLYVNPLRDLWKKWASQYVKQFDWTPIVTQYEDAYKEAVKIHEKKPKTKRRFSFRRQSR